MCVWWRKNILFWDASCLTIAALLLVMRLMAEQSPYYEGSIGKELW